MPASSSTSSSRLSPLPVAPLALLVPLGTPAMLAHAFLVIAALTERTRHPAPPELIPLTCNEVQHLFAVLLVPARW